MVVFILESVPQSLRGEMTRWLLEPKAGVFVGRISALVRDRLWEKACKACKSGGCLMIWQTNTEQGYSLQTYGQTSRKVIDFEGLKLVRIPQT